MTVRFDIVTNDAGDLVRREHARELGAGVVVALYRLARLAQLHDLTNQAFLRQLEETHALLRDYCLRAGSDVNILFAKRAVFVAGQLLKGSPGAYESATELGEVLERCGGQELTISRDVTQDELRKLAEAISSTAKGKSFRSPSPRVRLRAVNDAARLRGLEIEPMDDEQRVIRTYASAVVIMRRFLEDMAAGRAALPKRVKRIAQMLVDLSQGGTPAFLGVTEARNANHDDAGRAVNAAILAVAVAREMTDDRAMLSQIAMAAMMLDVGRPRALAAARTPRLSEEGEDKLPAGTAAVLTTLGRVNEATITRTVIAYEALWLRRAAFLGAVYQGVRQPTLQAKIVALARRYNDLVTPEPGLSPPPADFAIATLADECKEPSDRTVLRMLVCALGLFPVGTVVALSTQEVGEVLPSSDRRASPDAPRLRLVMDARGEVIDKLVEVDLAQPRAGEPARRIVKVLSVDGWKKGLDVPAAAQASGVRAAAEGPPATQRSTEANDELSDRVSEIPEEASVPSIGSTPSGVAEAFGRAIPGAPLPSPREREPAVPASQRGSASRKQDAPSPLLDRKGSPKEDGPRPKIPAAQARTTRDPLKDLVATAQGVLSATPLVHVLVYVLDHALSGTVVFREPDGAESLVYFDDGAPTKVRTHRPVALLGDEIVLAGVLARDGVDKALESATRLGALLGEYLVGNGLVPRDVIASALTTQLKKKLASLANLPPDTTYEFYRDANALESWGGDPIRAVHPLDIILACVRDWYDCARIHATVSRVGKQPLELHPEVDLSSLTLTQEEETVLAVIRGEAPTVLSLQQRHIADEEAIGSLVYTLAVTRQFALPNQKAPPMARKHEEKVRAAAAVNIDRVSALPFSAVVEPRPPSGKAKAAPEADLGATWRPPRPPTTPPTTNPAPPPEPLELELDVEVEVLPPESEAHDEKVLQAMTDFRLAETALQRRDIAMAERLALRAAEGDPSQLGYVALLAWVQAMSGTPQATADAISALSQLLAKDAKHERALLYRGQLYARAGRASDAKRDFEHIIDVNPNHREAASELRLLKARRGK